MSGLRKRAQDLPAQHVKHLRGRRRHAHLHVVLGAELQEALEARGGMLRALAFVAMRQEQREPAQAAPLRFARADELVDDDLRAVHEVAELAFPDDERRRIGGRVAVFEAEHGFFGQHRVGDLEATAGAPRCAAAGCSAAPVAWSCSTAWRWKNVPRPESWPVRRIAIAFFENAGVGQRLGAAPVERQLAARASSRDSAMTCATRGCSAKFSGKLHDALARAPCRRVDVARRRARARSSRCRGTCSSRRCTCCRSCRARRAPAGVPSSRPWRYCSTIAAASASVSTPSRDQLVGVELARGRMLADRPGTSSAAWPPARPPRCGRGGDSRRGR